MGRVPDCTYELYVAVFKDVAAAVRAGDTGRIATLRARIEARPGPRAAVCKLALDDAEGRSARRTKYEVCRPLCATRCERGV